MRMSFFEKSLLTLELPAVLNMLAGEAVSEPAKELALALRPSVEEAEVRRRLSETTAAKTMMVVRGSPSFSGVKDVRASLARADLGGALNTRELLDIARVLQCARLVRGYLADDSVGKTPIDYLFSALHANRFLEEKITGSIVGEDEIADAASSDLANIRRQMRAAAARAREALQKIISSPSYAKVLQEPIITLRSDRYVVPVKAEHKGAINGLVHDISASGATLFVEPMAAVKANNELRELAAKERAEIDRILAELSADCAEHREGITTDFDLLVQFQHPGRISAPGSELGDMQKTVVVKPDVHKRPEGGYVRYNTWKFHPRREILKFVDVVGECKVGCRLAGVQPGFCKFLENIVHGRQADLPLHILLCMDARAQFCISDQFPDADSESYICDFNHFATPLSEKLCTYSKNIH